MRYVRFKNPVFESGFNTTCRRGLKDYHVEEPIFLCDDNGNPICEAVIVSIYQGRLTQMLPGTLTCFGFVGTEKTKELTKDLKLV